MKDFEVEVLTKLGIIENNVKHIIKTNEEQDYLLKGHDKLLKGNGNNGLITKVSNLNLQMRIVIWASGAIISSTLWFVIRAVK